MDRLFISVKDRPNELTILCKSLLHSDMPQHINDVVFLDDHSEDPNVKRIYSAFKFALLPFRVHARFIEAKDGRKGINQSWERIRHYPCDRIWMLNGDMMVFSNYFEKCKTLLDVAEAKYKNESVIVSGFNTPLHPPIAKVGFQNAIQVSNVGGCSEVVYWKNLDKLLECFGMQKAMNRGWDLHIGEVFDKILVTNPSASQHLGFYEGLNQLYLSGFPGAWAEVRV